MKILRGVFPCIGNNPNEAAIIITSPLANLVIDSNVGFVKDYSEPHVGKYEFLIQPFQQLISVQAEGYLELRFWAQAHSAKQVLYYEIRPAEEEVEEMPILLTISPADAVVYINEEIVPDVQGMRLAVGVHRLRIEKEGYKTLTETIAVTENNSRFDYALEPVQLERITITTQPKPSRY